MEEENLLGLTHNESYLLERQKLEFRKEMRELEEREREEVRQYQERKVVREREYQERKEVRDREHREVMANIELEIAKLRNGRTFFSG